VGDTTEKSKFFPNKGELHEEDKVRAPVGRGGLKWLVRVRKRKGEFTRQVNNPYWVQTGSDSLSRS